MSLVTVSTKRKRVYKRKFDHDEALALYAAGWSVRDLASRFGVSVQAVRRVVVPGERERMDAATRAFLASGICPSCGGPATRVLPSDWSTFNGKRYRRNGLCRECFNDSLETRYRFDELGNLALVRCVTCKRWLDVDLFPRGRSRRNIHGQCRACNAKARQDYRERHKVPCVGCGKPALPPNEKRTGGAPFPRCRACFLKWQREEREARKKAA